MATVLILGATSEIAIATAQKFAGHKNNIQLAARSPEQLKALQSDIVIRYNVACSIHAFDAMQYDSHASFFDQLYPRPDITICVFGYLGDHKKGQTDWKETAAIIGTNYTGAVSILNIAANYYASQKAGTIIGISSVAGERGRQSNYLYGSAKAGFTAYLSGLRNALFSENVQVITVLPGFVYTKMTEDLNLPKLLTAQPAEVGDAIYNAVQKKKDIIYVRWFWRWIMLIIKSIPEFMFKKLKL